MRSEGIEPGGQAGLGGAPGSGEPQVEISERACERYVAHVDLAAKLAARLAAKLAAKLAAMLLRKGQGTSDLARLHVGPQCQAVLLGPVADLIDLEKGGIHDPVREGLAGQRVEAGETWRYDPT